MIKLETIKSTTPESIKTILRSLSLKYLVNAIKYKENPDGAVCAIARVSADTERDFTTGGMSSYRRKLKFYKDDGITSFFIYARSENNFMRYTNLPRYCEGLYLNEIDIKDDNFHIEFNDTSTGEKINLSIATKDIDKLVFKRNFLLKYIVGAE